MNKELVEFLTKEIEAGNLSPVATNDAAKRGEWHNELQNDAGDSVIAYNDEKRNFVIIETGEVLPGELQEYCRSICEFVNYNGGHDVKAADKCLANLVENARESYKEGVSTEQLLPEAIEIVGTSKDGHQITRYF